MASKKNWEKVREQITCAICLSLFEDPRTLSCLHTYCMKCLVNALKKTVPLQQGGVAAGNGGKIIQCPACRKAVTLEDNEIEGILVVTDIMVAMSTRKQKNRNRFIVAAIAVLVDY